MAMRERRTIVRQFRPEELVVRAEDGAADEQLPDGISGRMIGCACTYNTVDDYGTLFKPGCFDRTRSEKVPAGRVGLFRDHDHVSSAHVGVIRACPDMGDRMMMNADFFDTPEGRDARDYVKTVLAAGSYTGLSVGVYVRDGGREPDPANATDSVYAFREVELAEISITPFPAVPGADAIAARHSTRPDMTLKTQITALRTLLTSMPRADVLAIAKEFGLGELVTTIVDDVATRSVATSPGALVDDATRLAFLREHFQHVTTLNGRHP